MDDIIESDPEEAWAILVELSEIAFPAEAARVAAGPLEELLVARELYVYRAISEAAHNHRLRVMLRYVATQNMSAAARKAIHDVIGKP